MSSVFMVIMLLYRLVLIDIILILIYIFVIKEIWVLYFGKQASDGRKQIFTRQISEPYVLRPPPLRCRCTKCRHQPYVWAARSHHSGKARAAGQHPENTVVPPSLSNRGKHGHSPRSDG